MMTREDIRELASFQAEAEACAVSFYFQPGTPENRSHKAEAFTGSTETRKEWLCPCRPRPHSAARGEPPRQPGSCKGSVCLQQEQLLA